jgi:hypothetical protein
MKTTLLFLFLLFVCLINATTYTSAVTGWFEFQKGDSLRFITVSCRVRMVFNKYLVILYFCFVMIFRNCNGDLAAFQADGNFVRFCVCCNFLPRVVLSHAAALIGVVQT